MFVILDLVILLLHTSVTTARGSGYPQVVRQVLSVTQVLWHSNSRETHDFILCSIKCLGIETQQI